MVKKKDRSNGPSGITVASEALHLLRTAPFHITACYFFGTLPFLLLMIYFCSDMSRGAYAHKHCLPVSMWLVILFVWMKTWQSLFAAKLMTFVKGKEEPPWPVRRFLKVALYQAVIQPVGLLLIPFSMFLMVPFGYVYAYFQNITVLDNGESGIMELNQRASKMATLWPKQNHILMWILNPWLLGAGLLTLLACAALLKNFIPDLSYMEGTAMYYVMLILLLNVLVFTLLVIAPFSCTVFVNLAAMLAVLPFLLKMLFGIETVFTMSGQFAILNTTFLIIVSALSCMVIDPLCKAAYVLRCFYGESQTSGYDLLSSLREVKD